MSDLRIAIIIGSTRPNRKAEGVAKWVQEQGAARDASYELVDLADYPLPFFNEPMSPAMGQYDAQHQRDWANVVSQYDGYVFVTPEYNHSYSAVLKNAIDWLYTEWNDKAAAFVSYGGAGGARAVEHLRGVAAEMQLAGVRTQMAFSVMTDFENFTEFKPAEQNLARVQVMFDQLERWAGALKPLREAVKDPHQH